MTHFEYIAVMMSIILGLGIIRLGQPRNRFLQASLLATCGLGAVAVLASRPELVGTMGASESIVQRSHLFGNDCLRKFAVPVHGRPDEQSQQ